MAELSAKLDAERAATAALDQQFAAGFDAIDARMRDGFTVVEDGFVETHARLDEILALQERAIELATVLVEGNNRRHAPLD